MAGTQHSTLPMMIEAGGGWVAFAGFVGARIKDCPDLGSLLRGGR